MIHLSQLQFYLKDYLNYDKKLNVAKIDPYMTNGLMVGGSEDIKRIGFGVSASLSLFAKAKKSDCDAIIVHHSFNQPPYNRYDKIFQERISYLLKNNISLFGFHFLLDAHPEVGNNVQILKTISAQPTKPYLHQGEPWGWIGDYGLDMDLGKIETALLPSLSKRSITYHYGPHHIKKVVALSGKGAPSASDMQFLIDNHIDLFITGEIHEWNRELFREAGINCIAGGHYATERFGVSALRDNIKSHFKDIEADWLEVENEI